MMDDITATKGPNWIETAKSKERRFWYEEKKVYVF